MKLSSKALQVLAHFIANRDRQMSGTDVSKAVRIGSGTLYPLLMRLEKHGWLESQWEDEDPSQMGRPRRRLYKITGLGYREANAEINRIYSTMSDAPLGDAIPNIVWSKQWA
jgi:DNA-binding PadR family transcriptional regulator